MSKSLFVTVGTTEFDSLLEAVTSQESLNLLEKQSFNKIIIQKGRGHFKLDEMKKGNISFEIFDLSPSLAQYFDQADLILSHCGAGTLLDGLQKGKPMCAVVNNTLMDNHQSELLNELMRENYIYGIKDINNFQKEFANIITNASKQTLKKYPKPQTDLLNGVVESFYK